jgi:hypothetical protein
MVSGKTVLKRGFRTPELFRADALEGEAPQIGRRRPLRIPAVILSGLITLSMLALPVRTAFADGQVLELPQVSSAAVASSATSDDLVPLPPVPRHRSARQQVADSAPPAGVGSLADYMHQSDGESSPYPASAMSMSPAAGRYDPNGDRNAMVNNVILGVLALGLFAYEVHAANQHHRR